MFANSTEPQEWAMESENTSMEDISKDEEKAMMAKPEEDLEETLEVKQNGNKSNHVDV